MSHEVIITCDRCNQRVVGLVIETSEGNLTGGFYDMTGWKEFARNDDEKNVCDRCMWQDPEFIKLYPQIRKEPR